MAAMQGFRRLWNGGEEEGVEAELLGASARLGVAGGHGYGDDDGELRSVAGGETEERGGGRSRERGRSERGSGAAWRRGRDQGRRRQPGREEVASSAARVRARSCSHWQEEDDRGGGVAVAGWAGWAGSGGLHG